MYDVSESGNDAIQVYYIRHERYGSSEWFSMTTDPREAGILILVSFEDLLVLAIDVNQANSLKPIEMRLNDVRDFSRTLFEFNQLPGQHARILILGRDALMKSAFDDGSLQPIGMRLNEAIKPGGIKAFSILFKDRSKALFEEMSKHLERMSLELRIEQSIEHDQMEIWRKLR